MHGIGNAFRQECFYRLLEAGLEQHTTAVLLAFGALFALVPLFLWANVFFTMRSDTDGTWKSPPPVFGFSDKEKDVRTTSPKGNGVRIGTLRRGAN